MACDPAALIAQANCLFACIPQGMMPAVNVSLLCSIASAGGSDFPSGLTHYWTLNELSGNPRLDSVGSSNLAETGGPVASGTGIRSNSASFTDGGALTLRSGVINAGTTWSLVMWIFPQVQVDIQSAIEWDAFLVEISATGFITANFSDVTITKSLVFGIWNLVVITFNAGVVQFSLNGDAFAANVSATPSPNALLSIGGGVTNLSLNGKVDEVAIFNVVLTQSQVTVLWNSGAGTFP